VVFEIKTDKQLPYTCRQLKGGDGSYHIFTTRIRPCPSPVAIEVVISTSSSKQYSRECHQAAVLQAIMGNRRKSMSSQAIMIGGGKVRMPFPNTS